MPTVLSIAIFANPISSTEDRVVDLADSRKIGEKMDSSLKTFNAEFPNAIPAFDFFCFANVVESIFRIAPADAEQLKRCDTSTAFRIKLKFLFGEPLESDVVSASDGLGSKQMVELDFAALSKRKRK